MDATFRQIPIYSLLSAMIASNALCMVVDADHTFNLDGASAHGVDLAKILVSEPTNTNQAVEIIETIISTGTVRLIVVIGFESLLSGSAEKIAALSRTTGTTVMFAAS